MAVDFDGTEARVSDVAQRRESLGEIHLPAAESAAIAVAQVDVTERRAAVEDRLAKRLLLDVHMQRIDHGAKERRPHSVHHGSHLGDRVVEPNLKMIDRLEDDLDSSWPGRIREFPQAFLNSRVG